MIEIIHRYTKAVLYRSEKAETLAEGIREANLRRANLEGADLREADLVGANLREADLVGANLRRANLVGADLVGADLEGANLRGADLREADLVGANLRRANLEGANLRRANLEGADLVGADLVGANLRGADLVGADLEGANLRGADLRWANLVGANLRRADLEGANLRGADLDPIKQDLFAVLDAAPTEVTGLLTALRDGTIDGSSYEGECACLVGTIANTKGCNYSAVPGLKPDSNRPAERWFLAIGIGATPGTNPVSRLTEEWILEWLTKVTLCQQVARLTEPVSL